MKYEDSVGTEHQGAPAASFALSPEQQLIAFRDVEARLIVEAGPGTGKTETVAHRLVHLLTAGVRPSQILVLSFSRNAVGTLLARIEALRTVSVDCAEELRYLSVRTFDAWTFRTLRQLNHSPATLLQGVHDDNIERLIAELRGPNRHVVADLLRNIRHIIVDEFQDISGVRGTLVLELLRLLAPPEQAGVGFTVLGDPAQAIYAFALRSGPEDHAALTSGAMLRQIRTTYAESVTTLTLEHNHRTTDRLGSLAANLRRLLLRRTKASTKLDAMRKIMERIPVIEQDLEPGSLVGGQIRSAAVLTVTNGDAIRVARKLLSCGDRTVPVFLHAGTPARTVPAWIGMLLGPLRSRTITRSQFQKIYNLKFDGDNKIGVALNVPPAEIAWQRLSIACDAGPDATAIDVEMLRARLQWVDLMPDDEGPGSAGVHVMTIHQSKGMEFDAVLLMPESLVDREFSNDQEELEAANVLFVGVTRAAKSLLRVDDRHTYGPMFPREKDGRTRWYSLWNGWANVEMGAPGDIDATSFVNRQVFSEDGELVDESVVQETQAYLATHAIGLRGQKVMLCRWRVPGSTKTRYRYRIHVQDGNRPGRILGTTSDGLTYDLLDLLHAKGYYLPNSIFNLQIAAVVTMGLQTERTTALALPHAQSGLWLGVNLCGTGDFKIFKGSAAAGRKNTGTKKHARKRNKTAH